MSYLLFDSLICFLVQGPRVYIIPSNVLVDIDSTPSNAVWWCIRETVRLATVHRRQTQLFLRL